MSFRLASRLQPFYQRLELSQQKVDPHIIYYTKENRDQLNETCVPIMKLDNKTQNHIQNLVDLAKNYGCASLSAPQVGSHKTFFCVLKSKFLKPGRWLNYNYYPIPNKEKGTPLSIHDYDLYINPIITSSTINSQNDYDWEYCMSTPNMKAYIKRPASVKISYLDENFELQEKVLHGFQGRLFLHEYDHQKGETLIDNRPEHETSGYLKRVEFSDTIDEQFGSNDHTDENFEMMKLRANRSGGYDLTDAEVYIEEFEDRRKKIIDYLENHKDYLTGKHGTKNIDENLIIM